jgi:micrococcal nuclease
MSRNNIIALVGVLLLIPSLCWGWQGKVVAVADGDTLTVLHDGKKEQVHLYGVECPKKQQDGFQKAKDFAAAFVSGKPVEIEPREKDRFGRTMGTVTADGRNLNRELVKAGLGWAFVRGCKRPECLELTDLEKQAKAARIGLWAMSNPIPPWEFKHDKPIKSVYSGDVLTHKFHSTNCPDYGCKSCIANFKDRARAIAAGYTPCPQCNP